MDPLPPTFALGRLRDDTHEFTALVRGTTVLDLDLVADKLELTAPISVVALLEDWARVLPLLQTLTGTADLADYTVLAPVTPRQVFQSGANYRTHVIDLAMAHMEIAEGKTVDEVRVEVAAMMDERAATGKPYIFLGLPSSVGGPFDDVVLPGYSERHDWELELAAVIGATAFRVTREDALDHVSGYTIVNDITTRDQVFRKDMKEIGTDWFRAKNAPGFLPTGPWLVPAQVPDTRDLQITLKLNGKACRTNPPRTCSSMLPALISRGLPDHAPAPGRSRPHRQPRRQRPALPDGCSARATSWKAPSPGWAPKDALRGRGHTRPTEDAGPDRRRGQRLRRPPRRCPQLGPLGCDDVLGTLNFIDPDKRMEAAALVQPGEAFSLSQPFDTNGPQKGWRRRTNPVHTMTDTGVDAERGNQGFPHGFGGADDVDRHAAAVLHPVGRPRPHLRPRQGLERPPRRRCRHQRRRPGHRHRDRRRPDRHPRRPARRRPASIGATTASCPTVSPSPRTSRADHRTRRATQRRVGRGDIVVIRTGQHTRARREGWGDYAGGAAPGLSFSTAPWLHRTEIAAIATDTWGFEVRPNEFDGAFQPLHQIAIPNMGCSWARCGTRTHWPKPARRRQGRFPAHRRAAPDHRRRRRPVNPIAIK